jgi:hypothetical protein
MIKFFRNIRQRLVTESKFSKYLIYAIGEIILVVIGILIALQVNNWNTDRMNRTRVANYSRSLIQDLSNDIDMIKVSQFQALKSFERIDSLKSYVSSTLPENLSNTDLYLLTHDIMYRPFQWSRSTLDEMKSSEILQYFESDTLKSMLIAYESFSYHLDEDFKYDMINAQKAEDIATEILDLNNTYFSEIQVLENERFNDPTLDLFETEIYKRAKEDDSSLLSARSIDLKKFTNAYIVIQGSYRIRAFNEMPEIIADAEKIIQLLKNEK